MNIGVPRPLFERINTRNFKQRGADAYSLKHSLVWFCLYDKNVLYWHFVQQRQPV